MNINENTSLDSLVSAEINKHKKIETDHKKSPKGANE